MLTSAQNMAVSGHPFGPIWAVHLFGPLEAGGSLRDVQELAGHASLSTTQRYIQGDSAAERRVVDM
jgi:site-specific recombinase XerC